MRQRMFNDVQRALTGAGSIAVAWSAPSQVEDGSLCRGQPHAAAGAGTHFSGATSACGRVMGP